MQYINTFFGRDPIDWLTKVFLKGDFFRCLDENILITLQRSNVELVLLSPLIIRAAIED